MPARTRHAARKAPPSVREMSPASATRCFWLTFDEDVAGSPKKLNKLRKNLSAIELDGDALWLASDEHAFLDKLTLTKGGQHYAAHKRFPLKRTFKLSNNVRPIEADLEGLARDGRRLWLLGSHCRTRTPAKGADEASASSAANLDAFQLRSREETQNRHLLGCLDLDAEPEDTEPGFPRRAAARLPFTKGGNEITDLLANDEQLRPFLELPAKENGLDFEGLAVRGDTVFVGLRGPVIAGLATIIEFKVRIDEATRNVSLRPISSRRSCAKHALNMEGLGVRDLAFRGDRLLVLAAPTMPLDGIACIFEWDVVDRKRGGGIVKTTNCRPLLRLPGGNGQDYAEGMTLLKDEDAIAVVFDRPSPTRLRDPGDIRVDVFTLPKAASRGPLR